MAEKSSRIIVTVLGQDAGDGRANIVDISQTLMGSMFTMIMMVDTAGATLSFDELKRQLNAKGEELGMRIDAQREDVFKYMHRV